MKTHVLEIVTFRLRSGVSVEEFTAAGEATMPPVRQLPGFVDRRLVLAESGGFTDIVEWESMEAARGAMHAFGEIPEANVFAKMIDMDTLDLTHQRIVVRS